MRLLLEMLKSLFQLYTRQEKKQTNQEERQGHIYSRTQSSSQTQKKQIVKNIWIFSGLLMLTFPVLPIVILITLTTTFVSFVILDETDCDSQHRD